ncbi:cell wall metabolism sensor histidine kinase WalK [Arthrobacter sp. BF1]|uniref:sensor histidine kinase n=1 Tax=Arthrobacter sp. BF1 TaxID=2821145 RepID=UPI001C4F9B89|nr:ATP-binding protein [Arthrobacter sp. BF1]
MTDTPANQLIGRLFYQRSQRVRVMLAQLPFFLTVSLAALMIGILYPGLLSNSQLVVSLWLNGFLMLACLVVPWDKLHPASFLVIPYMDFFVVALFREGIQTLLSSAGMLALFPIFWICASCVAPKTAVATSTLASLLIIWNPVFQSGQVSADALIRPILFPFMMLAFAITVVVLTTSMEGQRNTLLDKDKLLRAALAESQHRELLLETVVDTVGVGVVVVDAHGHDRLMNSTQVAIHTLGRPLDIADPEEKELLLFTPDRVSLAPEARPVRRAINGESFTNYQIWIGTGEQARALSTTARIMRHDDGRSEGAVIAFHDVTDMVNALSAKDDFVANVSHEFRTPLTAIQSYIDLALEAPGLHPPEVGQYLKIADRNAERLGGLVGDLLATSSITVERTPTNMNRIVADSIASAAPGAAANSVAVDWQCEEPLLAMVDGVRISQVLDNLISNAVKYSPDGGTLTVRAWADGTDLRCRVSDTGLGMSCSEQAGVFQKFFRAGTAVERGIPGIGLGLMISKTIIDTHGGSLLLESQLGVGTTMSFVIPACVIDSSSTPKKVSPAGE